MLAAGISVRVKAEWESGVMREKVSPITGDLLSFWFGQAHCETRNTNFHEGQKQAILNAIYLHEVLKIESVYDIYNAIEPELLAQLDAGELRKEKYDIPKYAVKMATGTGKTLVMHALLLWQYLNAKREESRRGDFQNIFCLLRPASLFMNDCSMPILERKMRAEGEDLKHRICIFFVSFFYQKRIEMRHLDLCREV